MKRRPQVTRQGCYQYAFRYDPEAFNEVPVTAFRQALGAELGTTVGGIYNPLNQSPLYQPHTKRRYHISEEYWQAIDPARVQAPVAQRGFESESVLFSHPHLLADQPAMQAIVDACTKLPDERDELAEWAAAQVFEGPERRSHHVGARL